MIFLQVTSTLPACQRCILAPVNEPGQYILEYLGGRKVLVEIDEATGKQYFLREL